jgi:hypothetical protein
MVETIEKPVKKSWAQKQIDKKDAEIADLKAKLANLTDLGDPPAVLKAAKVKFIELQDKPYMAVRETDGTNGFSYSQRRNFGSDSGYDNNIIDRLMAMTTSITRKMLGTDGKVRTDLLPEFGMNNTLTVTIEVMPSD